MQDAPAIFAYASDPQVTRYLAWPQHKQISTVEQFVRDSKTWWDKGEHFAYMIVHEGEVAGSCGFLPGGEYKADLGYVIRRQNWGQGIAVEASQALMDWLWSVGMRRVGAFCHAENAASARVMEKLGMDREGLLRKWAVYPNLGFEPQDTLVYATAR